MATVTDPVCGMTIDEREAAATVEHDGKTYHFCSKHCAHRFTEHPEDYV